MTEGQVFGARRNPATAVDRRDERSPNYYLDWAFDEMKKLVDDAAEDRCTSASSSCGSRSTSACRSTPRRRSKACCAQYGREYQAQAGRHRADGHRRRGARHGRRPRLRRKPVQPRDRRAAPARLLVQALRLRHRAGEHGFKPTSIVVDSPVCIGNWCPQNYSGGYSGSMTLTTALTHSINIIPVKLSIALGNGNPKLGRAKIRETRAQGWASARRCPIRRRCRSAPTR